MLIPNHSDLNPDNPKDFLKVLHPATETGDIILERSIKQSFRGKARISPFQLITTANEIWGQPDYFVSPCRFNRFPYICHFKQTNALWIALPINKWANTEFIDSTLTKIGWQLSILEIPLWSFVIYEGGHLLFFWIVKTPIEHFQYHQWYLCQTTLYSLLKKQFGLSDKSLDAAETIRVVGSLNTQPRKYVRLEQNRDRKYDFSALKDSILNQSPLKFSKLNEAEEWNRRFFQLLDLLRLRHLKRQSQYKYWFLFMGLAISRFCPAYALQRELMVIARLIEGDSWSRIESKYLPLIQIFLRKNISSSDSFEWFEEAFNAQRTPWDSLIVEKLEITLDEKNSIESQTPTLGIHPHNSMSELSFNQTFTDLEEEFIPLNRLLINRVPNPLLH